MSSEERTIHDIQGFGNFRLDTARRRLTDADARVVPLRGKAFDVLDYLVANAGRVIPKDELLAAVWPRTVVEENNLNQAISAVRHALGDTASDPRYVATVTGRGYQFIAVTAADAGDSSPAPQRKAVRRAVVATATLALLALAWLAWWRNDAADRYPQIIEHFADAELALVTAFPGSHSDPSFSPDGSMMAFTSDASGQSQVWVMNLQQGDPQQITFGDEPARSPSWAPDNSQILFERQTVEGPAIYAVGPLGTPPPRRIIDFGRRPRFAADAPFVTYMLGLSVWVARDDGSEARRLEHLPLGPGFATPMPALSPNGQSVAFVHAKEGPLGTLWLAPVAGGEARELATLESGGGFVDAPVWTRDGRYIVYGVNSGTAHAQLRWIDVRSGESAVLTTGPAGNGQPAISADGSRLLFTKTHNAWRIVRIDLTAATREGVFESRNPIFLPLLSRELGKFVFFSMAPTGLQVFTVGENGDDLRQRTFDTPGQNTLPFWSGQEVVYYRDRLLARLDLEEGTYTALVPDFHWSRHTWPAISGERLAYFEFDRPAQLFRAAVRDLASGEEVTLDTAIESPGWNAAGDTLVGEDIQSGRIMTCNAGSGRCAPISGHADAIGMQPKWSADESRIFYLRAPNSPECCELWAIDADGSNPRRVADLDSYDLKNSFYSIGKDDVVYYNHADRSTDEIWLAHLR